MGLARIFIILMLLLTIVPAVRHGSSSVMIAMSPESQAISRGQGSGRGTWSSGSSFAVTLSPAPINRDTLIATVETYGASLLTVSSITETGVTWSKAIDSHYSNVEVEIWSGAVGSGASTGITITLSGTPVGAIADVYEYSGSLGVGPTRTNNGTGTSGDTGTTLSTTYPNQLWIGAIAATSGSAVGQSSPTNEFTLLDGVSTSFGTQYLSLAYLENITSFTGPSPGTYPGANSGTTISTSATWAGAIATFSHYYVCTYVYPDRSYLPGAKFLLGDIAYGDGENAPINISQPYSLDAQAPSGYSFAGWTITGGHGTSSIFITDSSSPDTTVTFGSEEWDKSCVGNLNVNYYPLVTITSSPVGSGLVAVDGVPYITPETFAWDPFSSHMISASSLASCGTGCQDIYVSWSDGGAQTHTIPASSPLVPATYTANFQTQYYLTMQAYPTNGGTVSPDSDWRNSGVSVPISATANAGWQLIDWTGTGSGSCSGKTCSGVTMNGAISETANFGDVTFLTNPSSSALISWRSCAGQGHADGESIYDISYGSVTACYVPSGYTFSSWSCTGGLACSGSNNPTTVTFTGPGTITLNLKTGSLSNPVSTSLTVSGPASNPAHGTQFTVSGTLTATGAGVSGKTIVLVFGWNSNIVTVTTAPDGSYTYTATAPASAGSYKIQAFFLGDYGGSTQYLPSTATATITVT